ncbi:MAG: hypothetical protein HFK03_00080 [Clostridia bacterium]|jgi:uncharacterized membrane protein|nr:hypothetical protein [Clostridia bacterium]
MRKDKAHFVAFVGVMAALIFVLFLLEGAVLSPVGMTACILSLPVAIAVSIYDDWKKSFVGGTLLGVCSCIFCLVFSAFIKYANPLVSVLPRFCIGVTAYWTYFGLSKLFKKAKNRFVNEALPAAIAGIVGSLTNTVLYLLAVAVCDGRAADALTVIMGVAVTIYFPIELAACAVLVPLYVKALQKVNRTLLNKKQPQPLAVTEAEKSE